jgi:hypothetical protein
MFICLYNNQVLEVWLVGDQLLLRDFGPYGIIFMNVCDVTAVAVVMFRDIGPYVFYLYVG